MEAHDLLTCSFHACISFLFYCSTQATGVLFICPAGNVTWHVQYPKEYMTSASNETYNVYVQKVIRSYVVIRTKYTEVAQSSR